MYFEKEAVNILVEEFPKTLYLFNFDMFRAEEGVLTELTWEFVIDHQQN